jgi:hypothetical protein
VNYWAKLGLSLAGLGALVGIWFGDEYYTKKEAEEKKIAEKVLNFESEKVRGILLKTGTDEFSFARDSATAEWKFLGQVAQIRPDQDAVNNFLSALKDMRRERDLEGYDEAKKADFGLDKPRRVIELTLEGDSKLAFEIGGDVQVGKAQGAEFKALSTYAHLLGDKNTKSLLVIPSSALTQTDKKFSDFRTKSVVHFSRDSVSSFSYVGKEGNVKVAKKDGNWSVTLQPSAATGAGAPEKVYGGDSNGIGLYIDKVQRLRADNVIEKTALGQNGTEKFGEYGLSNPARVVSFFNEGGELLQELKIGVNETRTNLVMADGAVAQIALDQFAELAPELKTFRDLKVMSGVDFSKVTKLVTSKGKSFQKEGQKWFPITDNNSAAPAEGKSAEAGRSDQESRSEAGTLASDFEFMRAKDIIDPEYLKNDQAYGFDQPIESFSFEFSADSAINKVGIKVGRRVETDEKNVYIKRDGSPAVYIVETTWMDSLKALEQDKPAPKTDGAPATGDSAVSPQAKKEN